MNRVNVAHIVDKLKVGGIERLVAILTEHLNRDKYNVFLYCLAEGGTIANELVKKGMKVQILKLISYHNLKNIFQLAKKLQSDNIQIIHSHGYFASTFSRLAAVLARVPIIFCPIYSTYYDYKFRNLIIERILSKITDSVIVCSEAVKQFVIEWMKISPQKVVLIHHGVPPVNLSVEDKKTLKKKWEIEENCKVIGTVTRLHPVKGIEYLIQAVKEVVKFKSDTKFLIAGDGPLKGNFIKLSQTLKLNEHIIFTGYVPDLREVYGAMDIFVLPSSEREGFSLSILEAMSCGLPVVATNIGGNKDAIIDKINGFLVPPKDYQALAQSILKLLNNESLIQQFSQEGYKIYNEKFTDKTMLSNIENLYDYFINKKLKFS